MKQNNTYQFYHRNIGKADFRTAYSLVRKNGATLCTNDLLEYLASEIFIHRNDRDKLPKSVGMRRNFLDLIKLMKGA